MAPKILIDHFVSPGFKNTFKIIVVICLSPAHSIRCSFTITIDTQDLVGYMPCQANYGSGGEDGPEFIHCVDGRQTQIHEVWNFGENGVTREVCSTVRIDVGSGFVG